MWRQVRSGEVVSQYEIMRFAQLFNDELTLDNLERIHLVNLCRFVGIQPFGTDAFLVSRLRTHLATIKARPSPGRWAGMPLQGNGAAGCLNPLICIEAGSSSFYAPAVSWCRLWQTVARHACGRPTTARSRRRAWTT